MTARIRRIEQVLRGRRSMKLKEIMRTRVATIELDDTLEVIRELFEKGHFHHLLVITEKKEVVGVISDRDLLKELSPFLNTISEQERDLATLRKKAHQIMSRRLISASPETTLHQAARLMIDNAISCLPVLEKSKTLVGIVTWKDILKRVV
jgi:acetoin utilization protein AcuB